MTSLAWFPEPFQAYGSFAGEGARRVLGKPRLDPWAVLVRETVQNSWDAKRPDSSSVDFAFDGWVLTDPQLRTLRQEVFTELPPAGIALGEILDREQVPVLVVSDRRTVGLTGPIRADRPAPGRSDFIDLVFNMGQPRDIPGGGGTYGFGKTIAYIISEASTVILYTRTRVEAELESRLIGVAVGTQWATDARRFTGRHWWGVPNDARIEPLVGAGADELAGALGFPAFDEDDTGLSIMVIAPRFNDRTPRQAMTFAANAIAWNFWPKMINLHADSGDVPMAFRVSWQDEQLDVPDPVCHPPLNAYVRALRALHAYQDEHEIDTTVSVVPIRAQRPNRQLGLLALTRTPREPRVEFDEGANEETDTGTAAGFSGNSHHVALMRQVELVVSYLEGPELPGHHVEWAGVFVNDADIDQAFSDAEPPTHDDWEPSMVEDKPSRRLVNLALRNIREELRRVFGPVTVSPATGAQSSAAIIGNALGGLIASASGTGTAKLPGMRLLGRETQPTATDGGEEDVAGGDSEGGGAASVPGMIGRGATGAILEMITRPITVDGAAGAEVEFRVDPRGVSTVITGNARAAIDGTGAEREPPLGAAVPEVVGFRRSDEPQISVDGSHLVVEADDKGQWVMVVRNPAEVAISVDLRVSPTGGAV